MSPPARRAPASWPCDRAKADPDRAPPSRPYLAQAQAGDPETALALLTVEAGHQLPRLHRAARRHVDARSVTHSVRRHGHALLPERFRRWGAPTHDRPLQLQALTGIVPAEGL